MQCDRSSAAPRVCMHDRKVFVPGRNNETNGVYQAWTPYSATQYRVQMRLWAGGNSMCTIYLEVRCLHTVGITHERTDILPLRTTSVSSGCKDDISCGWLDKGMNPRPYRLAIVVRGWTEIQHNEISDLNERQEALESDWNFLEHTFNSLQTGEEGLQLLQEIAHRLQELQKITTRP